MPCMGSYMYERTILSQMTTVYVMRDITEASLRFWFLSSILILELSFLLRTYHKFKPRLIPGDLNVYIHVLLPKLLDALKLTVQLLWGLNNFPKAAER